MTDHASGLQPRFVELIEQHKRIIYKISYAYARTLDDRQDLFQEIVVQLWSSFPRYDTQLKFSTWMYRVALNVAISHARRAERRPSRSIPVEQLIALPDRETEHLFDSDDFARLKASIQQLNEIDRAIIVLHLEGNSHADIATVLGLSPSNVGTRLARIKQQLRRSMNQAGTPTLQEPTHGIQ